VSQFNLIALTPPGLADPSIAIASARAGALGVMDLEYTTDVQAALAAIAELARHARRSCGIKLDSRADEFMAHVTGDLPEQIEVVILTIGAPHHRRLRSGLHHGRQSRRAPTVGSGRG
jgi:pheromone shutdown protein TraB